VSANNKPVGLSCFTGSISSCPPNPNNVRNIVFTNPNNLSVTFGANTEIQIPLSNFFIPIDNAARISFTVPGSTGGVTPYDIYKLDLGGVDLNGGVKFMALFPQFDKGTTGSSLVAGAITTCSTSLSNSTSSSLDPNSAYLEWTCIRSIDTGVLYTSDPVGITGNTNFGISTINKLSFSWGGYINFANGGTGSLYAATNGGLLKWDGEKSTLWNTLNSQITSDYVNSLTVDSSNNVWLATNQGVLVFNENSQNQFSQNFNVNGRVPNENAYDIKISSDNKIVIGTDNGVSVFNTDGSSYYNYNIYNSPLLKHNVISKVEVSSDSLIFAGTTGGVYAFDMTTSKWSKYPMNSTNIVGWNAPNNVQSLASYNGTLYVGTTGGLVVIPYTGITGSTSTPVIGITASTIKGGSASLPGGSTGSYTGYPYSDNYKCTRIEKYGSYQLYTGHGGSGGISILNINSNDWWTATGASASVTDVLPDFLSGSTNDVNLIYGSTGSGILKVMYQDPGIFTRGQIPDLNTTNPDLLLSVPYGATNTGNYVIDETRMYSSEQPIYFLFSKNMTNGATSGISIENFVSLNKGVTGAGATVSGTWSWDSTGKIGTFTPSSLSKAQGYNLRIAMGGQSNVDGTYLAEGLNVGFYTENIDPVLGWGPMGKMFVLSGSDIKYVQSIYLRNPQSTDINVIALIGR
jgi:hypothetical protein